MGICKALPPAFHRRMNLSTAKNNGRCLAISLTKGATLYGPTLLPPHASHIQPQHRRRVLATVYRLRLSATSVKLQFPPYLRQAFGYVFPSLVSPSRIEMLAIEV